MARPSGMDQAKKVAERFAAEDVSSPLKAGAVLRRELGALFPGHYVHVEDRGIGVGVKFARMDPEVYIREEFRTHYQMPWPNLEFGIVVAPGLGGKWGPGLNLRLSKDWPELQEAGVSFRRKSNLTPEKAVQTMLEFFRKYAATLRKPT